MSRGKNRDRLVEAGLDLFGQQGYSATGVQDITDAAGVPKGSFYNYFGSKEEFAVAVLDRYREHASGHFAVLQSPEIASPLGRLRALLTAMEAQLAATDFAGGCVAGRLTQELAGENPALRAPLCEVFTTMQAAIASCLQEARSQGEIDSADDPEQLASFLVNAWQGAMLRAKAEGSTAPLVVLRDITFSRLFVPLAP